jgi:hypothetical protein
MDRILGKFAGGRKDKWECVVCEDQNLRVYFTADADIDADGANGQNGAPAAYRGDDKGSEALKNGGMQIVDGKAVFIDAGNSITIRDADNQPKVFANGMIASMTWYRHRNLSMRDPAAFVDAETVAYVVVPPLIVHATAGVVRGCLARVTYKGKSIDCMVADKSGASSIGELSIEAARQLGIPCNPRTGGVDGPVVGYQLWPGVAAPGYELQPS